MFTTRHLCNLMQRLGITVRAVLVASNLSVWWFDALTRLVSACFPDCDGWCQKSGRRFERPRVTKGFVVVSKLGSPLRIQCARASARPRTLVKVCSARHQSSLLFSGPPMRSGRR
jgi:hypothetical protein